MKGLDVSVASSRMRIVNDLRTVTTTDGTMVCLLPTEQTFSTSITFPDFTKDEAYLWTWGVADSPIDSTKFQKGEWCSCMITAVPQEYLTSATLMAAPAGADFFVSSFKIARTTAPASTWMGRTLAVLPPTGQWMPLTGSALLEAEVGMARAMHCYINGGNLVLETEQSVSVATNGYGAFGDGVSPVNTLGNGGGEILNNGTAGLPIFLRDSKTYGYTSPAAGSASPTLYRRSGSSPCARSDTTNYQSIYSVDIKGRFGRRS